MNITSQEMPRTDYPAPDPARPYVYPGTQVLINLFDIRSMAVLNRVVNTVARLRGEQLQDDSIPGEFDLAHFCAVHRALFQDIFAWAGQIRTVDTEKQGLNFLPAADISVEFRRIHEELKDGSFLRGLGLATFASRLADYYYSIYAVHVFRDGNSRSLRHFCTALAAAAGYRLDFAAIDQPALTAACRQRYFNGDSGPLRACLRQISFPV
ncbi:MAG: Fic family protein [Rhodocyclales bacterium]|nr:Fic family protein [Rhodocyclales bacterium]